MDQEHDEVNLSMQNLVLAVCRHWSAFAAVCLVVLGAGFARTMFVVPMCRVSVMIKPPVAGPSLTGSDDLVLAENLRSMFAHGVFLGSLKDRTGLSDSSIPRITASALSGTNVVQLSLEVPQSRSGDALKFLQDLIAVASETYSRPVRDKLAEHDRLIVVQEHALDILKGKSAQDWLIVEALNKRQTVLKTEMDTVRQAAEKLLPRVNQDSVSYLLQLDKEFNDNEVRLSGLNFELQGLVTQIDDIRLRIEKLRADKAVFANISLVSDFAVAAVPTLPVKKKIMCAFLLTGFFFGVLMSWLLENARFRELLRLP